MCNSEYTYLKGYAHGKGYEDLKRALVLARELHEGQYRKASKGEEKLPYITHPIRVASHLMSLGVDDEKTLITAIMHDTYEDCDITLEGLKEQGIPVGAVVAINLVSYIGGKGNAKALEAHYKEMVSNPRAVLVKLSDRCHNMSTMMGAFSNEKVLKYVEETEIYIIPMAKKAKDIHPQYSNQIVAMRHELEAICELVKGLLRNEVKSVFFISDDQADSIYRADLLEDGDMMQYLVKNVGDMQTKSYQYPISRKEWEKRVKNETYTVIG